MTGNVGVLTRYSKQKDQVITEVIAPYDLFFEPGATEIEESSFVAIRKIVKKADLEKAYPDH